MMFIRHVVNTNNIYSMKHFLKDIEILHCNCMGKRYKIQTIIKLNDSFEKKDLEEKFASVYFPFTRRKILHIIKFRVSLEPLF